MLVSEFEMGIKGIKKGIKGGLGISCIEVLHFIGNIDRESEINDFSTVWDFQFLLSRGLIKELGTFVMKVVIRWDGKS